MLDIKCTSGDYFLMALVVNISILPLPSVGNLVHTKLKWLARWISEPTTAHGNPFAAIYRNITLNKVPMKFRLMWIYCNLVMYIPPKKRNNNLKPLLFFGRRFFFLLCKTKRQSQKEITSSNTPFSGGHVSFREGNCDLNKWMEFGLTWAKTSGPPLFFLHTQLGLHRPQGWVGLKLKFLGDVCERLTKTGEKRGWIQAQMDRFW